MYMYISATQFPDTTPIVTASADGRHDNDLVSSRLFAYHDSDITSEKGVDKGSVQSSPVAVNDKNLPEIAYSDSEMKEAEEKKHDTNEPKNTANNKTKKKKKVTADANALSTENNKRKKVKPKKKKLRTEEKQDNSTK
ncbi:hypothetical protein RFI_17241 [Reticulomyxa filosa]|uniref:Uncharacterized protein n=1 Tax=Reticulomyxa filosa TaxID=46433 RepID=X6N256_RETFI|nr:hypothetical protein RFI_17241 [Reticulomyxa filosa]|eukprot:ETO19978.1 hypothetical protein RFI_17241 [Reticulomyxa filosa]